MVAKVKKAKPAYAKGRPKRRYDFVSVHSKVHRLNAEIIDNNKPTAKTPVKARY